MTAGRRTSGEPRTHRHRAQKKADSSVAVQIPSNNRQILKSLMSSLFKMIHNFMYMHVNVPRQNKHTHSRQCLHVLMYSLDLAAYQAQNKYTYTYTHTHTHTHTHTAIHTNTKSNTYLSVCSDSSSRPGRRPSTKPWRAGISPSPRGR